MGLSLARLVGLMIYNLVYKRWQESTQLKLKCACVCVCVCVFFLFCFFCFLSFFEIALKGNYHDLLY